MKKTELSTNQSEQVTGGDRQYVVDQERQDPVWDDIDQERHDPVWDTVIEQERRDPAWNEISKATKNTTKK